MKWKGKKVFVTGGTGFLGKQLVKRLVNLGGEIIVLTRDDKCKKNIFQENQSLKIISGELEDVNFLVQTFKCYQIDLVFHLAAQSIAEKAKKQPMLTFSTNIFGTCCILEACRLAKVAQVIVASSIVVSEFTNQISLMDPNLLNAGSPYQVSKICSDLIAQTYASTYQLSVGIARLGNIYGGGDLNFNRIVPHTIQSLLKGAAPIVESNGKDVRDYLFIEDAIDGLILLAEHVSSEIVKGRTFNFLSETPITVLELVNKIIYHFKLDVQPIIQNEKSQERIPVMLSNQDVKKYLGWQPQYTLDEGINKTIKWYNEFLGE
ncbi:hypothetical protein BTW32_26080 [Bacillus thuringiensis]|nr:hypothetical protein BTW32_26080 [Bacillus thuringiensis]